MTDRPPEHADIPAGYTGLHLYFRFSPRAMACLDQSLGDRGTGLARRLAYGALTELSRTCDPGSLTLWTCTDAVGNLPAAAAAIEMVCPTHGLE
jgi:hypothetical protein